MDKNNSCIVILGPTGSGKTDVAAGVASLIGGEIISADSRQIYKHLNIGTNKAGVYDKTLKARVYNGIPQYLTDIIEPSEDYNAALFVLQALEKMAQIRKAGKIPIITGGTGLYLKALIDGLAPLPSADKELREKLSLKDNQVLYEELKTLDAVSAEKNKGNPQRLIRALEVCYLTGKKVSELQQNNIKPSADEFVQFGLLWEKDELYLNLDVRTEKMLKNGMIEETDRLLKNGLSADASGLRSIGYNHVVSFINKAMTKEELEKQFKLDMRHYAKRQMTWFNKDPRIKWLKANNQITPESLAKEITEQGKWNKE